MRSQRYNNLGSILVLIIVCTNLCILQTTTSAQAQVTNFSQSLSNYYSESIFPLSQTDNWMNTTYGMPGINLNQWSNMPTTWTNMYSNQAGNFMNTDYGIQRTGDYQYSNLSSMGMNQFGNPRSIWSNQFGNQSGNWMNRTGFLSGSGINQFSNMHSTWSNQFGTYLGNYNWRSGLMPGTWTNPISYQSSPWPYVPPTSNQSGGCGCAE